MELEGSWNMQFKRRGPNAIAHILILTLVLVSHKVNAQQIVLEGKEKTIGTPCRTIPVR